MQQLLQTTDYFSLHEMQRRRPQLFHQYVGRYKGTLQCEEPPSSLTDRALARLDEEQLQAMQISDDEGEDTSSDTGSDSSEGMALDAAVPSGLAVPPRPSAVDAQPTDSNRSKPSRVVTRVHFRPKGPGSATAAPAPPPPPVPTPALCPSPGPLGPRICFKGQTPATAAGPSHTGPAPNLRTLSATQQAAPQGPGPRPPRLRLRRRPGAAADWGDDTALSYGAWGEMEGEGVQGMEEDAPAGPQSHGLPRGGGVEGGWDEEADPEDEEEAEDDDDEEEEEEEEEDSEEEDDGAGLGPQEHSGMQVVACERGMGWGQGSTDPDFVSLRQCRSFRTVPRWGGNRRRLEHGSWRVVVGILNCQCSVTGGVVPDGRRRVAGGAIRTLTLVPFYYGMHSLMVSRHRS